MNLRILKVMENSDLPDTLAIIMEDGRREIYQFKGLIYVDDDAGLALPHYIRTDIDDVNMRTGVKYPWDV